MVDIKHIKQVNDGRNWKCGAVSLEMILRHYNIPCNQDDIWENIKSLRPNTIAHYYAKTCDLAKYSNDHGLPATIYKTNEDNFENALRYLADLSIPAILSIKEPRSNNSHFIVYTGFKNNLYYFCDPNSDRKFTTCKNVDIKDIWQPCLSKGITGYIFVVFGDIYSEDSCASCGHKYPIVQNELTEYADTMICPYCDSVIN